MECNSLDLAIDLYLSSVEISIDLSAIKIPTRVNLAKLIDRIIKVISLPSSLPCSVFYSVLDIGTIGCSIRMLTAHSQNSILDFFPTAFADDTS
uniref:AlNc14C201G8695 protein n=1 Tax=Albugo laibachii Nc14 TaxID=890382 RepID=F0WQN4_9STRA|nr:AlNc14C201G8695 [Albugo laibachii Nc14]|eukprot:CCA23643.1 AlNc14C201G8695 [Albugo laibachii Nc14]